MEKTVNQILVTKELYRDFETWAMGHGWFLYAKREARWGTSEFWVTPTGTSVEVPISEKKESWDNHQAKQ